eukprot:2574629-Amphidinium_carterae.1
MPEAAAAVEGHMVGGMVLHSSACKSDSDVASCVLEDKHGEVNAHSTDDNVSAFHIVAHHGPSDMVQQLLQVDSVSALHIASRQGHSDVLRQLLQLEGVDVNLPNKM